MDGVHLLRGRAAELAFSPFPPALTPTVAGFYTLDLATWAVHCDDQTYAMHGLESGAPPRLETFLERVPESDMPDLLTAIADLSRACGDYRIEYRIIGPDGALRSMEARGRVLADSNGMPQRMIGIAMDTSEHRAQRDAEHEFATRLQHQMLPGTLAAVPGVRTAAKYLPATTGMLIGGDWYDAVARRDGSLVLVIGDVQGHSVEAACLMGQLRTALHAFLSEGHDLDQALAMTNRMLTAGASGAGETLFASCCVVSLSPARGELQACRAGHPPPTLVTPDGVPCLLDLPAGLLLGVEADARYETVKAPLPAGSTVFLCTDGLLETGSGDLNAGLDRVMPVLAAGTGQDLDDLAEDLVATAQPVSARHDDIAVLVARTADQ